MQALKSILLVALLAPVFIFAVQNTEAVTVRFLNWNATYPLAITALAVYLVGMASGGTVVSLLTRLAREGLARRQDQ